MVTRHFGKTTENNQRSSLPYQEVICRDVICKLGWSRLQTGNLASHLQSGREHAFQIAVVVARVFNHYSQPEASRTHLNPDTHKVKLYIIHVNMELSTTNRWKATLLWNGYAYTKHVEKMAWYRGTVHVVQASTALLVRTPTCYVPANPVLKTDHNLPKCLLPKCPITKMSVTKMSYYQNVCYQDALLPKCPLPKCPITKMSSYQNVQLPKCPVTKMSCYQNVHYQSVLYQNVWSYTYITIHKQWWFLLQSAVNVSMFQSACSTVEWTPCSILK